MPNREIKNERSAPPPPPKKQDDLKKGVDVVKNPKKSLADRMKEAGAE